MQQNYIVKQRQDKYLGSEQAITMLINLIRSRNRHSV